MDWFPLQYWRSKCPEIVRVSSATGRTRHDVLGLLCDFWSWASTETADGRIPGVRIANLPDLIGGDAAFWSAVASVGWLAEDGGIVIPGWENWLSESAKKRARDRLRKQGERSDVRPDAPKVSANRPRERGQNADRTRTTVQDSTEQKKTEDASASCPEPPKPAASGPPVITFPCVGKGATEWPLTAAKLAEYGQSFPGVDVPAELRKARQWLLDNPGRRKTFAGVPRFLGSWLGKAQNDGRPAGRAPPTAFRDKTTQYAIDTAANIFGDMPDGRPDPTPAPRVFVATPALDGGREAVDG